MSLGRISKLFAAQNATQVVSLLTQLLLPPIFLHSYGVTLYGEWLALSAAIGYLSTVNYGIQTYTNMQMTIHYNRGEVEECVHLQSGGLFILLVVFASLAILLCAIFFIPLDTWLHLNIALREAQIILYLLSLQIIVGMVFGFFSGNYMVIGSAHRGTNFNNLNLLLSTLVTALLALLHARLVWIAAAQFVITVLMTLYLFVDFSRLAPALRPTLRYWRRTSLRAILKPSGHYALLYSSNILGYQLPVIVIQRVLGPVAVVTFSVTRTIYSMSRRLPSLVTNSIGPEVTITYGERNWKKLYQLYELSERVVLLLIPPVSFGAMLFTPLLLAVWLRRGSLYDPWVCLLFGVTIAIQSVKEHKYQFQFSTNQVRELSYMTPIAYGAMLLLSIPAMLWLGLPGMLIVWAVAELAQLIYLLQLNRKLFGREAQLSYRLVGILMLFLVAGAVACIWPVFHIAAMSLPKQALIASGVTLISLALSYWIFGVDEVRTLLWQRFRLCQSFRCGCSSMMQTTTQNGRAGLSPRQRLTFLAALLLVSSHFSLAYISEAQPFLDLRAFAAGLAVQPFQERALTAWMLRGAARFDSPHFELVLHRLLPAMGAAFNETTLVLLIVTWLSMAASIVVTRATLIKLTGDVLFSSWAAFLVPYMAYFTYILNFGPHFLLPYDLPSLFFFCTGFYLLVMRRPLLLIPLIAVATLNRETSLFLIVFYLVFEFSKRPELHRRSAVIVRAAGMLAAWIAMRAIVLHLYGHNPVEGSSRVADLKFLQNLSFLVKPQHWPAFASIFGFTLPIVVAARRYLEPVFLRRGLIVVGLWFALMLFVGVLIEIRIFGELISYMSVAMGMILHRRLASKSEVPA